jgi:hypothetical protein
VGVSTWLITPICDYTRQQDEEKYRNLKKQSQNIPQENLRGRKALVI